MVERRHLRLGPRPRPQEDVEVQGQRRHAPASSAHVALRTALSAFVRLLAPFLPYVTEEVWSWFNDGSVHRASWPTSDELAGGGDPAVLEAAASVLSEIRKAKTAAKA